MQGIEIIFIFFLIQKFFLYYMKINEKIYLTFSSLENLPKKPVIKISCE